MVDQVENNRRQQEAQWAKSMRWQLQNSLGGSFGQRGGGGGAGANQDSMNWAKFVQSGEAAVYGGNTRAAREAFNRRYHGGTVPLQRGQTVGDSQFDAYVKSIGGNPYSQESYYRNTGRTPNRSGGQGQGGHQSNRPDRGSREDRLRQMEQMQQTGSGNPLLDRYLAAVQEQTDSANDANESRYSEGKQELTDLRDRTMDRVDNYGIASKQDIEQRFTENLSNQRASLQARGLGNSSVLNAYSQRNDLNQTRELQRLSEQVDDRSAKYDQNLSNNLVSFIERRTDVAPDLNQSMAIAQQLGLGNDGQGFNANGGQGQGGSQGQSGGSQEGQYRQRQTRGSRGRGQQGTTMTPWGPVQNGSAHNLRNRMPVSVNPIGGAANAYFGIAQQPSPLQMAQQKIQQMQQQQGQRRQGQQQAPQQQQQQRPPQHPQKPSPQQLEEQRIQAYEEQKAKNREQARNRNLKVSGEREHRDFWLRSTHPQYAGENFHKLPNWKKKELSGRWNDARGTWLQSPPETLGH